MCGGIHPEGRTEGGQPGKRGVLTNNERTMTVRVFMPGKLVGCLYSWGEECDRQTLLDC